MTAVYINTLGCARNLVDSEFMAAVLQSAGSRIVPEPEKAEVIIVNTCSFIEPAVNESIDTILELASHKKSGSCRHMIVTGCLPQRFREEISDALPEVDVFLGTGAFDRILKAVEGKYERGACILPEPEKFPLQGAESGRRPSTFPYAYIKIAEGCNRKCTYCIIPRLRGRLRSRRPSDILMEAQTLIQEGYREIVLIAQDTSAYGLDLSPAESLAALLEKLAGLSFSTRFRFLYGSPDLTGDELIDTIARHTNIAPYFDLPVQHASERILRLMGRNYREQELLGLFEKIRSRVKDAAIRTTIMAGFPGETEEDFRQLAEFIGRAGFDHAGVFIYSDSEDLRSHTLPAHVPELEAGRRYDRLMSRQAEISLEKNIRRKGRVYPVLVEDRLDKGLYIGRAPFQAPEVDGITYIDSPGLIIGNFYNVRIKEAYAYDIRGEAECQA